MRAVLLCSLLLGLPATIDGEGLAMQHSRRLQARSAGMQGLRDRFSHLAQKAIVQVDGQLQVDERRLQSLTCVFRCPRLVGAIAAFTPYLGITMGQTAVGMKVDFNQMLEVMCPWADVVTCMEQFPADCSVTTGNATLDAQLVPQLDMESTLRCTCNCTGMKDIMVAGQEPTIQNMCGSAAKVLPCIEKGGVCHQEFGALYPNYESFQLMCDADKANCTNELLNVGATASSCVSAAANTNFNTCSSKLASAASNINKTATEVLTAGGLAVEECCNSAKAMLECGTSNCMAYALAIAETQSNLQLPAELQSQMTSTSSSFSSNLTTSWKSVCPNVALPTPKTVAELQLEANKEVRGDTVQPNGEGVSSTVRAAGTSFVAFLLSLAFVARS
eukprot:TRINITY_DN24543_c0_g1_i1.p1 TRINITY_DN24543_c0_g1~~TRINITY_DN24543_c0_g1_i1.p1  ORF type:complete len:389 (+),score=86.53 TRINITY_DN24543_c0_g1_i1:78-1244(+)